MTKTLLILVVLIAAVLSTRTADAASGISVVYFYPRDVTPTMTASEADTVMLGVQQWYEAQVGQTFVLQPAQLVRGQRDLAYYQENIWNNILIELGYWCGTGVHIIIVPQVVDYAGGGSCDPVYSSGERGGTAMAIQGHPVGALAHELGHAFALPHPLGCGITWPEYCGDTVMWAWWSYPNVGLLDIAEAPEITTLRSSVWFGALAEPAPCIPKYNPHGKVVGKCR